MNQSAKDKIEQQKKKKNSQQTPHTPRSSSPQPSAQPTTNNRSKMEYNVRISIGEDGAVTTNVRGPTGGDFDANLQKYVGQQFGGKKTIKKHKKTNKKHKKTNKK